MSGLFLDQLDLLLKRALDSGHIERECLECMDDASEGTINIPIGMQENGLISKLVVLLFKLGKIAYDDLISSESHLVFKEEILLKSLGEREVDLLLKVGILSQMRAPGVFHVPKVSIEFLHKSFQEAIAALYIVCDTSETALDSLCEVCCTLDRVMEMSNVVQLIGGLSHDLGCKFSQHVLRIASTDHALLKGRDLKLRHHGLRSRTLHEFHCRNFAEMSRTLSSKHSQSPMKYHVSDIYIYPYDSSEMVSHTRDMMLGSVDSIVAFNMIARNHAHWTPQCLLQVLPRCTLLTVLDIVYEYIDPCDEFVRILPSLTHVKLVAFCHLSLNPKDGHDVDSRVVRAILAIPGLEYVELESIGLHDDVLHLTDDMTHLEKAELSRCRMSVNGMKVFIESLVDLKHDVHVTILDMNLGEYILDLIKKSKHFKVTTNKGHHIDDEELNTYYYLLSIFQFSFKPQI